MMENIIISNHMMIYAAVSYKWYCESTSNYIEAETPLGPWGVHRVTAFPRGAGGREASTPGPCEGGPAVYVFRFIHFLIVEHLTRSPSPSPAPVTSP